MPASDPCATTKLDLDDACSFHPTPMLPTIPRDLDRHHRAVFDSRLRQHFPPPFE
jgi:hypothetical protein